MNDKFTMIDVIDEIVVGGYGNLEGNLGLLKYNKEDIRKMITENNNGNDNIRLINSLLQSLKELQEQLQQKEDIINKITNYCKFQIEKEQDKFPQPLESEKWLKERLSAFEEILDMECIRNIR